MPRRRRFAFRGVSASSARIRSKLRRFNGCEGETKKQLMERDVLFALSDMREVNLSRLDKRKEQDG